MKQAALIFPHQLFKSSPVLSKEREIFLVEAPCFFFGGAIPLKFHKKKLLLHRASMQAYKKRLEAQGYRLHSLDFREDLFKSLRQKKVEEIWFVDPVDRGLEEGLKQEARKGRMGLHRLSSPAFLTPEEWLLSFFKGAGHFSMTRFYMAQRKRLKILLEGDRPIGGEVELRSREPEEDFHGGFHPSMALLRTESSGRRSEKIGLIEWAGEG